VLSSWESALFLACDLLGVVQCNATCEPGLISLQYAIDVLDTFATSRLPHCQDPRETVQANDQGTNILITISSLRSVISASSRFSSAIK